LEEFASQGDLKVQLFAEAKDKILIRLSNIADLFDESPPKTPLFNLKNYVRALF